MRKPRGAILRRNQRQITPAASGANKGEMQCEVTAANTATAGSVAPVSPAVSPPISPSTVENNKTETDGNQRGSQSGNGNTKPNCYECKHQGDVPGSAHSSCRHPAFSAVNADPLLSIMSILGSVGRVAPFKVTSEECKVVGNPHGIKNGWFFHPMNFDPVWLVSCTGFERREQR